jgi:hypothetical protein
MDKPNNIDSSRRQKEFEEIFFTAMKSGSAGNPLRVPKNDPTKKFLAFHEQLKVCHEIVEAYIKLGSLETIHSLAHRLWYAGVEITDHNQVIKILEQMKGKIYFRQDTRQFMHITHVNNGEERGKGNPFVIAKKKRIRAEALRSAAFLLAVLFLASLGTVFAFRTGFPKDCADYLTGMYGSVKTADYSIQSDEEVAGPRTIAASSLVEKNIPREPCLEDTVMEMVNSANFSAALQIMNKSSGRLDPEFVSRTTARVKVLVNLNLACSNKAISRLINDSLYQEAFEMQNCFDKNVYQLAGDGHSSKLRKHIVTQWTFGLIGKGCSSDKAMCLVAEVVRKITQDRRYFVAASNDGDGFYLGYTPYNKSKSIAARKKAKRLASN